MPTHLKTMRKISMALLCETERLIVRHFELSDSDFIIQLLNQASFIRYIADKNVRTTEDAIQYLTNGPIASYQHYGFGLSMVVLKACGTPVGMCGVLKRPELEHPDLGYAFLEKHWRQGYAEEAAKAVLADAFERYQLEQILAVTLPDNQASNGLLQKLGFSQLGTKELYGMENNLYGIVG
ncbi:TPA: GNAT family N-acetyltransferase [Vibrio vulnificus]|nr:GNAT family N-acetyltransferase [Vibrio vulnificus]HAS6092945.1 GNAT family N-acetyltransferase [Vibrio vulnificus]HAS6244901.1 GNAT family N-acetyltransferase [Vibrio vulnificus]HAS6249080.1 GNAT family N-acetyltransferase [Vibrio vulnificus]HAS6273081.1 GNAT family N-acetyltransferase [Vibrio vulnificus]